jgi:hypothetical protein
MTFNCRFQIYQSMRRLEADTVLYQVLLRFARVPLELIFDHQCTAYP